MPNEEGLKPILPDGQIIGVFPCTTVGAAVENPARSNMGSSFPSAINQRQM
jgi:hypothetical protein